MSEPQVVLVVLVLIAFVIGWVARGRREAGPVRANVHVRAGELDAAIGAALTCFQAALALWQIESGDPSARAARAIEAFEKRRAGFADLTSGVDLPAPAREAITREGAALDRLGEGLACYRAGAALDAERERRLLGAERKLASARSAFLLAMAAEAARGDS